MNEHWTKQKFNSGIPVYALMLLMSSLLLGTYQVNATTFTVNSLGDANTGSANAGTLRYCIEQANLSAGPHTVNFSVAGTITLSTRLVINQQMSINGYSAPGAAANTFANRTLTVQVILPGGSDNSSFEVNASNTTISGINFISNHNGGFPQFAIYHNLSVAGVANNVWIWGCSFNTNLAGTGTYANAGGGGIGIYGNANTAVTGRPAGLSNLTAWIIGTNGDGTNDANEGNQFTANDAALGGFAGNEAIRLSNTDNFVLAGNYFGLQKDGITPLQAFNTTTGVAQNYYVIIENAIGTRIGTDMNGTSDVLERNVIAGARGAAIAIFSNHNTGSLSTDPAYTLRSPGNNVIYGNYIGTNATGLATGADLRNRIGIRIEGSNSNIIGSSTNVAGRNVIVNTIGSAVSIRGYRANNSSIPITASNNTVSGNYIGVLSNGTSASGNGTGVYIGDVSNMQTNDISAINNTVSLNVIANSTNAGVNLYAFNREQVRNNIVTQNSVYANGALGINLSSADDDLAVSPNDGALDAASSIVSANQMTDYGIITNMSLSGNNLSIAGYVGNNAAGSSTFANAIVEFFIADNSPANQNGARISGDGLSVPHGEGKTYIGSLTANANGVFSGTLNVAGFGITTGTAITNTARTGTNTSEFGANVIVNMIQGNVYNDMNGLNSGGIVDGTGTNTGGTLYTALYNVSTGRVEAYATVAADGRYAMSTLPGVDYSVYLTTTLPTIGSVVTPSLTLPAGWANTGENNCLNTAGCAGSDGTADGMLALGILSTPITQANFGINQTPTAVATDPAIQANPGATVSVDIKPGFGGTDPNSGTITSYNITGFPANATSIIINGTPYTTLSAIQTAFPNGIPTSATIRLDPADGPVTVSIPFTVTDNAGLTSTNTAILNIVFSATYIVQGNVYNDNDGSIGGANGNAVDGTASGSALYANLYTNSNVFVGSAQVQNDGTYSIPNVPNGTGYKLQISNTQATTGSTYTANAALPGTYKNVSSSETPSDADGTITLSVNNSNNTGNNFGINMPPTAVPSDFTGLPNLGGTNSALITGGFGGTDPNNGEIAFMKISSFPFNATSLIIDGISYNTINAINTAYPNGIPTNAAGVPTVPVRVDPNFGGAGTVQIPFTVVDKAGLTSPVVNLNVGFVPTRIIQGAVYNDNNGAISGVNGTVIDGTAAATPLYANLYDNTGNFVSSAQVQNNGFYTLTNVPNGAGYRVQISSIQATAGGTFAPGAPLPGTFVNVSSNETPSESDGVIVVNVSGADVFSVNFGINQPPTAAADVNNSGVLGQPLVTNVVGNDTDPNSGSIDATRVSLVAPVGSTVNSTDAQGDITSVTVPGQGTWTVNPTTGTVTFTPISGFSGNPSPINYTVRDNASLTSNAASITVTYPTVTVSGRVVNDANNSAAIQDGSEGGTSAGGALFVYAVDGSNNIIGKALVNAGTGDYSMSLSPGVNYTLTLSNQNLAVYGSSATLINQLPNGWTATGEGLNNTDDNNANGKIELNTGAGNTTNANFGIQQLPDTDNKTYALPTQPAGNAMIPLNGVGSNPPLMSGTDPEDGTYTGNTGTIRSPQGVRIASLPVNGELWYSGIHVTNANLNTTIYGDPSLFSIKLTGSGYATTSFSYAYVDAAGSTDPTPADYSINWSTPLPVSLLSFDAAVKANSVVLTWSTAREYNNKGFHIQRSADGATWSNIAFENSLADNGNSSSILHYKFVDIAPFNGKNFYRLSQVDVDGKESISDVKQVNILSTTQIQVYPNPTRHLLTVNGLSGHEILKIVDLTGKTVLETKCNQTKVVIDLNSVVEGVYYLYIQSSGVTKAEKVIKLKN